MIAEIGKYADVYCYFDRLSLGSCLKIYTGIDYSLQDTIFQDLKKIDQILGADDVLVFIQKMITLVGIRNCIMHCNSLTILIRFYNAKKHDIRTKRNRFEFSNLVKFYHKNLYHK